MKKLLSVLLIFAMLLLSACGSEPSGVIDLTHRLVDGSPAWIFDFTYQNTTRQPLNVVALEILSDGETEQITGQGLVQEGLTSYDTIEPNEIFSVYLTTESLNVKPEYTFVLTLRKPDNTCFSHTVTYRLADIEQFADVVPNRTEQPEQEQSSATEPLPEPSVDGAVPLEPENGTDWHFIFDFLNETDEELTLETMEVINLMNGQQLDIFSIPAADLVPEPIVVAPGEPFRFDDWHPVVPDFNGRIYHFQFSTASGGHYGHEFIFDLLGANTPSAPQQPMTDPDAPADALLPVFANDEYHWQFVSSFVNETNEKLTFQELHIIDHMDGQMLGDTLLTADDLQHIQTTVEPNQPFVFEDWHPVVDFFNERHYIFIFSTPSGQSVEYPFEYRLSMDTTQRRDPVNAQAAALPQIDYANDNGRDLIALRHDASFSMEVEPDVFWVPAVVLGGSDYDNRDVHSMVSLSPEAKQQRIDTLYEALQLYEISDFTPSDDNVRMNENGVNWEHHKPGYYAVTTNTGCCATDSNWLNYILKDDYEEVGFIATSQRDGNGHIYNYIKHEGWYYFIDLTAHRRCDNVAIPEDGEPSTFDARNFGLNGILRARSIDAYVDFVQKTFIDPPGLMFQYTAGDCLALDSLREQHGITILYGAPKDVNVQVIFDDPNDTLACRFTDPPARTPDWH